MEKKFTKKESGEVSEMKEEEEIGKPAKPKAKVVPQ